MSQHYYKDGIKIECHCISENGHVGQVVILNGTTLSDDHPFGGYHQPYAFTIVERVDGENGYYIIVDSEAKKYKLSLCGTKSTESDALGWMICNLYDANEWLAWKDGETKNEFADKKREVKELKSNIALLKDILIKQGFRIITEEQAKVLVIKP